jgi:hypothetical protein
MNTKKLIILLTLFTMIFTSCGIKQSETSPSNPASQEQVKVVRIESEPLGASVNIDDNYSGKTPLSIKLKIGKHNFAFYKDGYVWHSMENIEIKEDTKEIKVTLKKFDEVNLIRTTTSDLGEALLNLPSKLIFVSNDTIYVSDGNGRKTEKIAELNDDPDIRSLYSIRFYGTSRFYGISPDSKWLILYIYPEAFWQGDDFLYALNIETLKLVKVTEDGGEGGFRISFEMGNDKLIYGFQGVNAPLFGINCLDLNTGKLSYLLDSSKNNEERAYDYDISPDKKYIAYAGGNVEVFPDNRTGLYLKNLETGELKMLVSSKDIHQYSEDDLISNIEFVSGGREILYSEVVDIPGQNFVTKYFIVDFDGHRKEISSEDAYKLTTEKEEELETKLKNALNKNLYINAVLDKCKKIVFTNSENVEKLYICNDDLSNIVFTGITNPNFMHFSLDSCKFTCEVPSPIQISASPNSTWYLIDVETNKKTNLNELFKTEVGDAIYIGK